MTGSVRLRLGADIDLRSPAPECFQVVNARHLVGSVVQALEADLAKVSANESCELRGPLSYGLLDRLRRGVEQDHIDVFFGEVPFPYADNATVMNDGRQRVVDELALPA